MNKLTMEHLDNNCLGVIYMKKNVELIDGKWSIMWKCRKCKQECADKELKGVY